MGSLPSYKLAAVQIDIVQDNVLALASLLPLLTPFDLVRAIGGQALCLTLTGVLAWYVVMRKSGHQKILPRYWLRASLWIYVTSCLISLVLHPTVASLFGSRLSRLGSVELIACIGIGLCLRHVSSKRLDKWLYGSLTLLAIISLPYSLLRAHHFVRIGGLPHQPDFLAILLAVAILIGCSLWRITPHKWRYVLIATQLYIVCVMFTTQTRAVIAISTFVIVIWLWLGPLKLVRKLIYTVAILSLLFVGTLTIQHATDGRLTDAGFASQSTNYRLVLQEFAVQAVVHKPLLGYGIDGIAHALACPTLHNPALQHTCHSSYYFDSSHNIFIDRFLQLGAVGGLSFLIIVAAALWNGLKHRGKNNVYAYCTLLIVLYYFTNVTNIEIEMLLWIMLGRCFYYRQPADNVINN